MAATGEEIPQQSEADRGAALTALRTELEEVLNIKIFAPSILHESVLLELTLSRQY
jgi:hypothetical protein